MEPTINIPYDLWVTFEELSLASEALLVKLAWDPHNPKVLEEYRWVYNVLMALRQDPPQNFAAGEITPQSPSRRLRKFFAKKR